MGIGLRATLGAYKLLILQTATIAQTRTFAVARYTPGTRPKSEPTFTTFPFCFQYLGASAFRSHYFSSRSAKSLPFSAVYVGPGLAVVSIVSKVERDSQCIDYDRSAAGTFADFHTKGLRDLADLSPIARPTKPTARGVNRPGASVRALLDEVAEVTKRSAVGTFVNEEFARIDSRVPRDNPACPQSPLQGFDSGIVIGRGRDSLTLGWGLGRRRSADGSFEV